MYDNYMFDRIIIAPDSFKGSASSIDVARMIYDEIIGALEAVRNSYKTEYERKREILLMPMSDGGENFSKICNQYYNCEINTVKVHGAYGENLSVQWYWNAADKMAIADTASVLGHGLLWQELNPLVADSKGVGEVLLEIYKHNPRMILLGLGGVSTVDGGRGMVEYLRNEFPEIINVLFRDEVKLIGLSDVNNPLLGKNGAACVFGPQKGATRDMIKELENRINSFAHEIGGENWKEISERPGAGAAGGIGFAVMALGGKLESGADAIIELSGLKRILDERTLVITGEGCSDRTTLMGKIPGRLLDVCKQAGAMIWLLSGMVKDRELLEDAGFDKIIELRDQNVSLAENMAKEKLQKNIRQNLECNWIQDY